MADVKHITSTCPVKDCTEKAFVQVIVFKDAETQKKVDAKARRKIKKQLKEWHDGGQHG